MSTYTDLHNRIKENLTILRKPGSKDDGMSPQKVILINPENQFYGTFNGKMNITSGILSGLKIIDSELEGVELAQATVDGVSLGELKVTVETNSQDIEQLQEDVKVISAAHNALSVGLSSAIDDLSVGVNKKIDDAISGLKEEISGIVDGVETLSNNLDELSGKVETLSTNMLNGVVYRGILELHRDVYARPRSLFNDDPACCLLEGTQDLLRNGWMWRVKLDHTEVDGKMNVSGDYVLVQDPNTNTSCYLGEGDYVIIKNHIASMYDVVPDDKMRLDDFDVINAQDADDTKLIVLKQISSYLDNKIDETLVSAKTYTDIQIENLSSTTSDLISATSADTLAKAKSYAETYADRRIDELSGAVDSRLTALSNDLSSYSNELCSKLSSEVDASYVHKAGDTIAKLSIDGDLSVVGKTTLRNSLEIDDKFGPTTGTYAKISDAGVVIKTHAGTTLKSDDQIEIKTNAPIVETASRFRGTFTNGLEISSDAGLASLSVNGKTIQRTLDELSGNLDQKKLDVDLARQLSSLLALSADISWDLKDYINSPGFMVSNDVGLRYDSAAKRIYLITNGSHHASAEIDTTDFVKDGMLNGAHFLPNGHDGSGVPEIELDFNTDAGIDRIYIKVGDLVDVYTASEDGIHLSDNVFSLKYEDIKEQTGLNQLCDDLFGTVGTSPTEGILPGLQRQIDEISADDFGILDFTGHLVPDVGSPAYESLSGFFKSCIGFDDHENPDHVKNGAAYNIFFRNAESTNISSVTISNGIGSIISVGNGDVFIVHDHSNSRFIHLSNLVLANDQGGNTYLLKAGVSRYEFELEAKNRTDDDAFISSWIKQNFANTGDQNGLLTTILRQEVSASENLSVRHDAFVFNDLSVAGQLFVNGAQLGIKTETDPTTGGDTTVAQTVADEISFIAKDDAGSSDDAPTISITKTSIILSSAPVYVDATSSFIISADQTKVIDATSSQVEILSVLNVETDKATITTLSTGVLSVGFDSLVDSNFGASVQDICVGLSTCIQNLSDDLSSQIQSLSTDLSTRISSLTINLYDSLEHVATDSIISSLNCNSRISDVICAVVGIRDTLVDLRSTLSGLVLAI